MQFVELIVYCRTIALRNAGEDFDELFIDDLDFISILLVSEELTLFFGLGLEKGGELLLHGGHVLEEGGFGNEYLVLDAGELGCLVDELEELDWHLN